MTQNSAPSTRQLLQGIVTAGWRPNGTEPDDCQDYTNYHVLVDTVWAAWQSSEADEPGTGHFAARGAFMAMNANGEYDDLVTDIEKPLPEKEQDYKTEDYVEVLRRLGYNFRLNECDDHVEVNGERITDVGEAVIRTKLRDQGLRNVNVARDAYVAEAKRNSYHPIRAYLQSLVWDGKDHIGEMTRHVRDKHGVFATYFKCWAIGAVAKAFKAVPNRLLGLDGPQGIGKSFLVAHLASPMQDYFVEGPINPDNKDDLARLANKWIWEVSELGSTTRRADREALKYFLTMRHVTVRLPYGRHDLRKPALASFIGTVNNEGGILDDPTGSRRFMVCTLESIDWNYTRVDPNQIWAQAYALYRRNVPWDLSPEMAARAEEINDEYRVPDPLEDLVRVLFVFDADHENWKMTTRQIREKLNIAKWELNSHRAEEMALKPVLVKLGAKKQKVRDPSTGVRCQGYVGIRERRDSDFAM